MSDTPEKSKHFLVYIKGRDVTEAKNALLKLIETNSIEDGHPLMDLEYMFVIALYVPSDTAALELMSWCYRNGATWSASAKGVVESVYPCKLLEMQ